MLRQLRTALPVHQYNYTNTIQTPKQRHFTHKCENSMKTNMSNRWLPFRGQHPFKIHMKPLKHACRNTLAHTVTLPTYTHQQTPSLCSHAPLSYTSCLWGTVCVKCRSLRAQQRAITRYQQMISLLLRRVQDVGLSVKPWCVWWMNGSGTELETLCLGLFGLFRHIQRIWMLDIKLQVRQQRQ